jgi:transposase
MAVGYSLDLRKRVVAAIQEGMSRRKAARLFKVSPSVAVRWKQREVETGSCAAKPTGGDRRSHALEAHQAWLLVLIAEEPDLTLEEIRGRLAAELAFKASVSMLWRFFHRHKISFKKNAARRRTGPPGRGHSASAMA